MMCTRNNCLNDLMEFNNGDIFTSLHNKRNIEQLLLYKNICEYTSQLLLLLFDI